MAGVYRAFQKQANSNLRWEQSQFEITDCCQRRSGAKAYSPAATNGGFRFAQLGSDTLAGVFFISSW